MKKFLSLALTFTISSLGLISMMAQPTRAQQIASAGKSISEIKEEYERLLAVDRDPSTPAEVRELNQQFLDKRRTQLRAALEARLGGLRKYQAAMGASLSGEESIVVGNSIQALEKDLSALGGEQRKAAPSSTPRARLISTNPNASPRLASPASSEPSKDAQTAQAIRASYPDEDKTNREPERGADTNTPTKARALEVMSPDRDRTVHVSEVEVEVGIYDEDIDDIMVAVYTPASEKPKSARILNIKRSDKGVKSVVVSLSKGDNRIEISDLKRSDIKAERNITFTSPEAPGIGAAAAAAKASAQDDDEESAKKKENEEEASANKMKVAVLDSQSKEYDWGRIRGYFTGGVVFSKEREDFSKADTVFSFVLDKNYIQNRHWNFNTFFEARLSSVPVAAKDTSSDTPATGGNAATQKADENEVDTFIASRKAAMAQAGIYVPFNVTHWQHDRRLNTLFIGPVAKGGIQTITNGDSSAEAKLLGADDVYNFFSIGVRLGHYSYPKPARPCVDNDYVVYLRAKRTNERNREDARFINTLARDVALRILDGLASDDKDKRDAARKDLNEQKLKAGVTDQPGSWDDWDYDNGRNCDEPWDYAPELISWLDITRGRWENFELEVPTGFNDSAGTPITVRRRPWRYQAEGRLKIPGGPFLVGFDGNFGEGKDDVRFGFGMRFDVGKLIQKLKAIEAFKALDEAQQDAKAKEDAEKKKD